MKITNSQYNMLKIKPGLKSASDKKATYKKPTFRKPVILKYYIAGIFGKQILMNFHFEIKRFKNG